MSETVRVAGVQLDICLKAPEQNLANMSSATEEASAGGAELVVFPECAVAGYCFDSVDDAMLMAESIPGPSTDRMLEVCQRSKVHTVFGLLEEDEGRLFNACVLVGPGGVVGSYRKTHLPFLGVDRFTTLGDRPYEVFSVGPMRIGMNICYDAAFPEAARVLALRGADLIVLPTNWPPGAESTADCVIAARALENHVYYMAVNRIGVECGFEFIGRSKVANPDGSLQATAGHQNRAILYADIDLQLARNKKIVRVPKRHEIHRFDDRRPDLYGQLTESE